MSELRIFILRVITPEGGEQFFPLPEGITRLGRSSDNNLQLKSDRVSRYHATITRVGQVCTISDLGSGNGTWVKGEKLNPNEGIAINLGERIEIGSFQISVEIKAEALTEEKVNDYQLPTIIRSAIKEEETTHGAPISEFLSDTSMPLAENLTVPENLNDVFEKAILLSSVPSAPYPLPDVSFSGSRLNSFLPDIYHTQFMSQFLSIFEAVLLPIEWNVDNFDLYLDPKTAPSPFLSWLASWFGVTFDSTWSEPQRRQLLKEVAEIFARRGTKWSLSKVLEIYTGKSPKIIDMDKDLAPYTFRVDIPLSQTEINQAVVEGLIDANKPAFTTYQLVFSGTQTV